MYTYANIHIYPNYLSTYMYVPFPVDKINCTITSLFIICGGPFLLPSFNHFFFFRGEGGYQIYILLFIVHVFSEMSTFISYLYKITLIFECVIYFTLSIWILISCVLSAVSFVCEGKIYDKVTWTSACRLGEIK